MILYVTTYMLDYSVFIFKYFFTLLRIAIAKYYHNVIRILSKNSKTNMNN